MNVPSKRTWLKFARDVGFAAAAAVVLYVANHLADLGVTPELAVAVSPVLFIIYRYLRDDRTTPEGGQP